MMINAFSMLADEFKEYKLVIYGQGVLEDELRQQIASLGLTDRIILPGFASNILEKERPCTMLFHRLTLKVYQTPCWRPWEWAYRLSLQIAL